MPLDEHQFEQAARNEQIERDSAIAAARAKKRRDKPLHDATGRRICKGCSNPLDLERLKVMPDAVRCIHCQGLMEKWGY